MLGLSIGSSFAYLAVHNPREGADAGGDGTAAAAYGLSAASAACSERHVQVLANPNGSRATPCAVLLRANEAAVVGEAALAAPSSQATANEAAANSGLVHLLDPDACAARSQAFAFDTALMPLDEKAFAAGGAKASRSSAKKKGAGDAPKAAEAPDRAEAAAGAETCLGLAAHGGKVRCSGVQLLKILISQLKRQSRDASGVDAQECCVVAPSHFSEVQRRRLLLACELAQLRPVAVLDEPLAVAIAAGLDRRGPAPALPEREAAVVLTVGAFCASAAVLERFSGALAPLGAAFVDEGLGGDAFAQALLEDCAREFRSKSGLDVLESPRALRRLRAQVDFAVRSLSRATDAVVAVDSLYEGFDLRVRVSRARFEELAAPLWRRLAALLRRASAAAAEGGARVRHVVAAGGGAHMPKAQQLLRAAFPGAALPDLGPLHFEELAAAGAAMHGGALRAQLPPGAEEEPLVPLQADAAAGGGPREALPVAPLHVGVRLEGAPPGAAALALAAGALLPAAGAARVARPKEDAATLEVVCCAGERWEDGRAIVVAQVELAAVDEVEEDAGPPGGAGDAGEEEALAALRGAVEAAQGELKKAKAEGNMGEAKALMKKVKAAKAELKEAEARAEEASARRAAKAAPTCDVLVSMELRVDGTLDISVEDEATGYSESFAVHAEDDES